MVWKLPYALIHLLLPVGLCLLAAGWVLGLAVDDPHLTGRLVASLHVAVPAGWAAALAYGLAAIAGAAGLGFLAGARMMRGHSPLVAPTDRALAGLVEVGLYANALVVLHGVYWSRSAWGTWPWADPRWTWMALGLVGFGLAAAIPAVLRWLWPGDGARAIAALLAPIALGGLGIAWVGLVWMRPSLGFHVVVQPSTLTAWAMWIALAGYVALGLWYVVVRILAPIRRAPRPWGIARIRR